MRTYTGSCHCGRVRFEIDADLDHARSCDCSFCSKRAAVVHRVAESHFRLLSDPSQLTTYRFHTRTATHYFCRTCGIFPFHRPRTAPDVWGVNVRCLDGIDLASIPVRIVHGSRLA